jgi:hypothetical protein
MRLRVPVGIDRDENDLDAIAISPQSFQIGGQLHQGARADVRAEREAEEKRRRQAGDVALGERSTVLGDQIESDTWAGRGRRGTYRGKPWVLFQVLLPASLPLMFSGLRVRLACLSS